MGEVTLPPTPKAASGAVTSDDAVTAVVAGVPPLGGADSAPSERSADSDADAGTVVGGRLGRYVVLEEVGRGGMGRVLRAYDPKLQREVAIKEIHRGVFGGESSARLVAEARAMAKLSHPNVVAIYDVDDSDPTGQVILVMEHVAGRTLKAWLRETERPWAEVVACFLAAGRGLAAAHAVGLLHRDFKPANVLLSEGGTVKVTDFGLAKAVAGADSGSIHPSGEVVSSSEVVVADLGLGELTQAGVVMGTPRYMAPEQHRGESLTVSVDQYAFCVALWEALCGEPPFSGKALHERKRAGPPAWPRGTRVPRPVADAVRRGLQPDPHDRWPRIDALLDALAYDPSRRRTRMLQVGGALALAGLGGLGWQAWAQARTERCTSAADKLTDHWDEPRRAAMRSAFSAIDASYATQAWARTEAALDTYATEWVAMHTEACEATTVRGEQSSAVMDLRIGCLHRAAVDLRAAVGVLVEADAEVVAKAHEVVAGLSPLSRCADVDALQADVEPPAEADAEAVETARALLAEASSRREAGQYEAAQERVEEAETRLATVDYAPVQVELALMRASVFDLLGKYAEAEADYAHALELASALRSWASMHAATTGLLHVVGSLERRPDEALRYVDLAKGLAAGDPVREASTHSSLGTVLDAQGKYAEAEAEHRIALAQQEKALGPEHPDIATSRNNLANALDAQGKHAEAEAEHRIVLAQQEKALGPQHPDVATTRSNLGTVLYAQGKYADAESEHRLVLALRQKALGSEHPEVASTLNNLATTLQVQKKHAEAETAHRRALALWEETLGAAHPNCAISHNNIGNVLNAQGKHAEAEAEHRLALGLWEKTLGAEHPYVATSHGNLANSLEAQGKHAEAEVEHRLALALHEKTVGPEHPDVAMTRNNLAIALHAQRRYAEAEVEGRLAHAIYEKALGPEHPNTAAAATTLANALAAQGK